MKDKVFKVEWPAGRVLVHAANEQSAIDTAVKYLRAPSAPKFKTEEVVICAPEDKDAPIS